MEEYYRTIIDIESYKKRTDSVGRYVVKAIGLFPDRIDFRLAKGHVASLSGDYDRASGPTKSRSRMPRRIRCAAWSGA